MATRTVHRTRPTLVNRMLRLNLLHARHLHARKAFVLLAVLGCLLQTGCVRRRLLVRSNPPGALVYVDNQPIGTTPCATDFTYYGTREIRLVKAGYETLTVNQPLPAPWYQLPPLDFVSENLVPSKIHDYRTASFNMVPQVIVPTEQLIARGEQLRQSTLQGAVLPPTTLGQPIPVLPPNASPGQPIFVAPTPGQPMLGQPTLGQPTLGQPTLAPTQPTLVPQINGAPPAGLLPQPQPGTGATPISGQSIEALPPPRQ